jgi:hypothetical protein
MTTLRHRLFFLLLVAAGCERSASLDLSAYDLSTSDQSGFDAAVSRDAAESTVPPTVVSTNPSPGLTNLCIPFGIEATFDKQIDPLTLTSVTFMLAGPGTTPVAGAVSYDAPSRTATFVPGSALSANTSYTATLTTGVKDLGGRGLTADKVWTFMTSTSPCMLAVNLRSLSTFVAVAGAGLTNTNSGGVTTLNGDVGLSPTATCLGDGIPCSATNPTINGTLFANDPGGKAAAAKADLVSAYNEAVGRPPGTLEADLSGLVLAPGVYTSASTMLIATSGILTLDGNGDQNAVWIFQVGSSLTVGTAAEVVLTNGAKAANVFWAVGASSTLNANVKWKGTILAQSSNSVEVGSVVDGRLLCTDGQITLKSDTINLP